MGVSRPSLLIESSTCDLVDLCTMQDLVVFSLASYFQLPNMSEIREEVNLKYQNHRHKGMKLTHTALT